MISEKVKQLQQWLNDRGDIDLALVFGSYATSRQHSKSDIDVAIRLTSGMAITAQQKLQYINDLGRYLKLDVDLIDLFSVGQPLLSQIIKYGRQLKGNSDQYAELALKNINTAQDFMPYIERMMSERRAKLLSDG